MNMTDPIADMLTRIRNASLARHQSVMIPSSGIKMEIARILKDEGYVRDFDVPPDMGGRMFRVWLKYGPDKKLRSEEPFVPAGDERPETLRRHRKKRYCGASSRAALPARRRGC